MAVVGVDGCGKGWVAAALVDGAITAVEYLPRIDALAAVFPEATTVAIDIPIGLPDDSDRRADIEAKKLLGKGGSSVFHTPPRVVLEAPSHAAATALAVEMTGKGISQQSYALRKKILEVDRWLPSTPLDAREVHPEVSFAILMGAPATASKKRWGGMTERRAALARVGLEVRNISTDAARLAAVDDVLDALVAAWSAERIARGEARSLPDRGEPPSRIDMTIWY